MRDAVAGVLAARAGQRSETGFRLGLVAALLLHGGLLAALIFAPEGEPPKPLEFVPVRVVPVAALGRPDPAPQKKASPPRAEPAPPRREPEPVESLPDPEPAPSLPSPEPAAEPENRLDRRPPTENPPPARDEPPADRAPAPPASARGQGSERASGTEPGREGSPLGSPMGTTPFGATRLEGIDPDFTYDYYLDRMLSLIHGNWQRPYTEGEVRTVVIFTVRKDGKIVDLDIEEESGFSTFDLAALRAVQNASPLPPLPASYRKGELRVTLIVR